MFLEMSDLKIDKLLQKADSLELQNFEVKNSMTNIFSGVVELVKRRTVVVKKRDNEIYEFTPKMLFDIFEQNNPKYFADLLWQNSTSNKKLGKKKPVFESPRRSVYRLIVKKD